jgi:hypothetical protein
MSYQLVRQAIAEKRQVVAYYDGLYREMCPHVIGWNKRGIEQVLFYQFAGESSRGIFPINSPQAFQNWRCMEIRKLEGAQLREGEWLSISRHTRPQTCVATVDLEVTGWV